MKDYAFEPHGPQTEEPPLSTADKVRAALAIVAYVVALALCDAIERGF